MATSTDTTRSTPDARKAERKARWREEAEFFRARVPGEIRGIDPKVVSRYARARSPWFEKEFRFKLLGSLAGQRVLDVGCGMGDNAILLTLAGAEVTSVDVSPESIEVADRRARASGLTRLPRFVCAPIEVAPLPEREFDVVWADGLLHHVLPELDAVLTRLSVLARPGARAVFAEPVNRAPALRRLRRAVPIPFEASPGERPLEEAELATIRHHLPNLRIRAFGLFGRANRFLLPAGYEGAPLARRALANLLCAADWALLFAEPLARAGGMAVLYGRFPGPGGRLDSPGDGVGPGRPEPLDPVVASVPGRDC